ncbi:hypothetical protein [Spirosoma montaniterrae]|uniref:hypothetical protein n=1 Tax=Spirosoma montaniterrae TaxID=1178516 RepID=UPI0012FA65EE|nr:hypothetical protein [Spirosoma montaniterrae]
MNRAKVVTQLPEDKPVVVTSKRSPIVQQKLDQANADLAKLSPEDLELLLGRKKR